MRVYLGWLLRLVRMLAVTSMLTSICRAWHHTLPPIKTHHFDLIDIHCSISPPIDIPFNNPAYLILGMLTGVYSGNVRIYKHSSGLTIFHHIPFHCHSLQAWPKLLSSPFLSNEYSFENTVFLSNLKGQQYLKIYWIIMPSYLKFSWAATVYTKE